MSARRGRLTVYIGPAAGFDLHVVAFETERERS